MNTSVLEDGGVAERGSFITSFRPSKDFRGWRYKLFTADSAEIVFGHETADTAGNRFANAVQKWERLSPRYSIVVTHDRVFLLFMRENVGIGAVGSWRDLKSPASVIIYNSDWEMIHTGFNDLPWALRAKLEIVLETWDVSATCDFGNSTTLWKQLGSVKMSTPKEAVQRASRQVQLIA